MPPRPTTRSRVIPGPQQVGVLRTRTNSGIVSIDRASWNLDGMQITASEGHPFNRLHKGSLEDFGGDFYTTKSYVAQPPGSFSSPYVQNLVSGGQVKADKVFYSPLPPNDGRRILAPPSMSSSSSTLDKLGATAIARCQPGTSVASALQALIELRREGLPHLLGSKTWQNRAATAKQSGDDYLSLQFGWRPLVNDVTSFAKGIIDSRELLAQYERDAGKVVRRRYNFPISNDVTESVLNPATFGSTLPINNAFFQTASSAQLILRREVRRRRWFSGAFTYWLPADYDSRKELNRIALLAEKLLGGQLTPELLWNIAPWSWAVDWFSNTGDVIRNVSRFASGGLVMRYGYMMEHTIVKDTYTLSKSTVSSSYGAPTASPISFVTETKLRRKANPFGFGVSWDGLSPFQTSILVALGITKGGR